MATNNILNTSLVGQSGTGAFVGSTSPVLTAPDLGAALATSINFGGGALNAYFIGTWTPIFSFTTPGNLSVVYTGQQGFYVRVGRYMLIRFNIACTPTFTTSSGSFIIPGLPIASGATLGVAYGSVVNAGSGISYGASKTFIVTYLGQNSTNLIIGANGSAQNNTAFTPANFTSGSVVQFSGSLSYQLD